MSSFDAESIPSPLAIREYARLRFDTDLEALKDWLSGLRARGGHQAGPALVLALEGLRKADLSARRRISILSLLKVPVLKTCAGLPKPYANEPGGARGLTMEQRLGRLMFVNLDRALHQLDKEYPVPNERQQHQRLWLIRNLFRFANRQIRYAIQWKKALPEGQWRELHELYLYLTLRRPTSLWDLDRPPMTVGEFDHEVQYKTLLLLGLAAKLKDALAQSEDFMQALPAWAAQTRLEDPHRLLGRMRLFIVEVSADRPPRQLMGSLDTAFRGWVLQPPSLYLQKLASDRFEAGILGDQMLELVSL